MTPRLHDPKTMRRQRSEAALILEKCKNDLVQLYDWRTFAMEDHDVHLIHEVIQKLNQVIGEFKQ